MPVGKYILMHSVIYRTGLLRECGLELPEHHLLCRQPVCLPAPALCEDHVLYGRELLPVFYRAGRTSQYMRM